MANEYAVAIHDFLSDKIAGTEKYLTDAEKLRDLASFRYYAGQLKELNSIRQYMAAKIDLKTQKYY